MAITIIIIGFIAVFALGGAWAHAKLALGRKASRARASSLYAEQVAADNPALKP